MLKHEDDVIPTPFKDTPGQRSRLGRLALLLSTSLLLSSCSGNTNSSGPAVPLPNGQTGSLVALQASGSYGNCYVSDSAACSTTVFLGSKGITALAAGKVSGTNYLYLGDKGNSIYFISTPTTALPTPALCGSAAATISSIAINTVSSILFYATSGGIFNGGTIGAVSCLGTSLSSSITTTTGLAYNASAGIVVGVTSNAQYFTASTTAITSGPTLLPNLQDTSPQITAVASDPTLPIVYIAAIGVNTNRIYAYYVSGTSLTYLGNYSGQELSYPSGIALFTGANPTQQYCTSGSCTFMDVTNTGNATVTQYVLTYGGSGTGTSVSINQFNNAYFDCDLINSGAIASILPTSGTLNKPEVFLGENGTSTGPCMGLGAVSYGNNVTAYTVSGE